MCPSQVSAESEAGPPPARRRRRTALLASIAAAIILALGFFEIHPFLAVSDPVPTKVLVVEGWLPDYALEEALAEYRRKGYDRIYTTGGPLEQGSYLKEYRTYAELAAATFIKLGLSVDEVRAVPSQERHRNRTYESALALSDFLAFNGVKLDAINLVTEGTHARRSRLCFRRALGSHVCVGIIAIENRDYESAQWWRYSSGIKTILGETLAVLYAWLSVDYGS
jgi:uncharacterized SAM-binding protein YcdF (DUF218 family)